MGATAAGWEQKALASVMAKFPNFQRAQEDSALLLSFPGSTSGDFQLFPSPAAQTRAGGGELLSHTAP